jgi:hypothetical protein
MSNISIKCLILPHSVVIDKYSQNLIHGIFFAASPEEQGYKAV